MWQEAMNSGVTAAAAQAGGDLDALQSMGPMQWGALGTAIPERLVPVTALRQSARAPSAKKGDTHTQQERVAATAIQERRQRRSS